MIGYYSRSQGRRHLPFVPAASSQSQSQLWVSVVFTCWYWQVDVDVVLVFCLLVFKNKYFNNHSLYFFLIPCRKQIFVTMPKPKPINPGIGKDNVQCPVPGCPKTSIRRDNWQHHIKNKVILESDDKNPVSVQSPLFKKANKDFHRRWIQPGQSSISGCYWGTH